MTTTITRERFKNAWTTTLAASMTINQTTVQFTTVSGLPASGQMRFLLGSSNSGEKILVTLDNAETTLTCERGIEGTTAATHTSGEAVTAVLTAAGLDNFADWIRASTVTHEGEVIVHEGEVVYEGGE